MTRCGKHHEFAQRTGLVGFNKAWKGITQAGADATAVCRSFHQRMLSASTRIAWAVCTVFWNTEPTSKPSS